MIKNETIQDAVRNIVSYMMDNVMDAVLVQDPFILEQFYAQKPLYAALVPNEIFKGSHFERRFVTRFGNAWERLAVEVGSINHGKCLKGYTIDGTVGDESLRRIQEVLNRLEHSTGGVKKAKPNWNDELEYILAGGGNPLPVSVVCDIFIASKKTKNNYAFELKAPLPNSDQTKVSKEKMFKLLAMNEHPVDYAYFALPYNPYVNKKDYSWSFPNRWFDMKNDSAVLIGDEFWNLIGGNGTYKMFIDEINKLGKGYKERIYREFLGIEPPEGFDIETLK